MSSEDNDDDRTRIVAPPASPAGQPATQVASPPTAFPATGPAPAPTSGSAASSAGDSGNALPVGTYLGEFELQSVLGEGGFGIVYLAWDHSLERRVALKEYMPSSLASRNVPGGGATQVQVKSERHRGTFEAGMKSFINEAKLLAQFDHPSLVKVYRFWEANGTAYMVMPFYEGVTMKDKLREHGQPPDEAWLMGILAPLTEALAVIHKENCFHRDIAPDNVILLKPTGRPLLLDFGAARRVIGDMTQALTVILKPGYAPVEQYAETPNMKQGGWTDIYALAASVHYAITGRTPPPSVSRLMSDNYEPLAQVAAGRYSDGFLQAMDKALRVRPEERTQSIAELRVDLGLEAEPTSNVQVTRMEPRPMSASAAPAPRAAEPAAVAKKSSPVLPIVGALVVAGAGLGAWLMMGSGGEVKKPVTSAAEPASAPAVATPAPAPVAAAAAARFEPLIEFDKVLAAQAPGFTVEVKAAKPQLRIGKDRLGFTVKSARDGFVSVLVLGPDGSLMQLFPNAQATDNRIKAGQTLSLPHSSWALDTAEPTGMEHFLVLVSETARDYALLGTEKEDIFLKLPTGQSADALLAGWKRPTPMLAGTGGSDAFGAARFSVEVLR